ncbi:MAG: tetratricopeptide repeat protein [Alphaproteobacteria bacterium]
MIRYTSFVIALCGASLCACHGANSATFDMADSKKSSLVQTIETPKSKSNKEIINVRAGNYLASRFAQSRHDWNSAHSFIQELLNEETVTYDLLERAMILAIGAGDTERAITIAHHLKTENKDNILADLILIVDAFKQQQYQKADTIYDTLPASPTVSFISPFLKGWIDAANGKTNIINLQGNTIQLYHALLISDFLGDHSEIEGVIDNALNIDEIQVSDLHRIADLYGHVGLTDKAVELYKTLQKQYPDRIAISNKIEALQNGTQEPLFEAVTSATHGMARAFHDIATLLSNEQNDESARIFAHIALYLEPTLTETKFLLAEINEKHAQLSNAITYLKSVSKDDEQYIKAQHAIADIHIENDEYDKAVSLLEKLSKKYKNVETLIKIGDLQRHQSNFGIALKHYDQAMKQMGGTVSEEYWHLHYVRGIAYEQSNNWNKAEEELKAALSFRPDNPYVLNYLGYAWADQGVNLQESLAMIQKAVDLRPSDGYITDSLGWVLYRKKDYKQAVSVLERAVELLPYDPTINDHLGDAYWQVGRKLEARFQWEKAKNHSEDNTQIKTIKEKLVSGPKPDKKAVQ